MILLNIKKHLSEYGEMTKMLFFNNHVDYIVLFDNADDNSNLVKLLSDGNKRITRYAAYVDAPEELMVIDILLTLMPSGNGISSYITARILNSGNSDGDMILFSSEDKYYKWLKIKYLII